MLMLHLSSSTYDTAPKPAPVSPAEAPADERHGAAKATPRWQKYGKYGTPILVLLCSCSTLLDPSLRCAQVLAIRKPYPYSFQHPVLAVVRHNRLRVQKPGPPISLRIMENDAQRMPMS